MAEILNIVIVNGGALVISAVLLAVTDGHVRFCKIYKNQVLKLVSYLIFGGAYIGSMLALSSILNRFYGEVPNWSRVTAFLILFLSLPIYYAVNYNRLKLMRRSGAPDKENT